MKKNHTFLLILLVSVIYFSNGSCNRIDYSKEISKVDSLSIEINSIISRFENLDSSKVMNYVPLMKEDLKWINDSLTKEYVTDAKMFLYMVKTTNKLTLTFVFDYTKLDRELNFSKDQIIDLKNDLSNSSIKKEEAIKYISDEQQAITILDSQLSKIEGRVNLLEDYPKVRKEFYLKMRNK